MDNPDTPDTPAPKTYTEKDQEVVFNKGKGIGIALAVSFSTPLLWQD
jgi:hypothetical protein